MQISVTGKQLDLGEALTAHVTERLGVTVAKYFDNAVQSQVVFSREAHLFHAECLVHVGGGISIRAQAEADEIYASFDLALSHLEKRLRRDKRRRRNHHTGPKP
jgi:ribosomal subunit interface protein